MRRYERGHRYANVAETEAVYLAILEHPDLTYRQIIRITRVREDRVGSALRALQRRRRIYSHKAGRVRRWRVFKPLSQTPSHRRLRQ